MVIHDPGKKNDYLAGDDFPEPSSMVRSNEAAKKILAREMAAIENLDEFCCVPSD